MQNTRNNVLDIAKLCMAVLVSLAHCGFLYNQSELLGHFFLNGITRLIVPIFLMINGFYFDCENNFQLFKWFKRVLLLYLFWMLVYSFFWIKNSHDSFLIVLLFGWHHLWYIPTLLVSGILFYFLRNVKALLLISILLFFGGVTLQYLTRYNIISGLSILNNGYAYKNFLFFGFPFFSFGNFLRNQMHYLKKFKRLLLIFFAFSAVLLFIESYINFLYLDKGVDLMLIQIILCPTIFILLHNSSFKIKFNTKKIPLYASGIYFIHTIPMLYFLPWLNYKSISLSFSTVIISFLLSFVLIKVNKKVRFIL